MAARRLTLIEAKELSSSVDGWLHECQRWIDEFTKLLPERLRDFPEDADPLIIAATYFIMAGGCVYLHCESLLEFKLGASEAKKWLKDYVNSRPALKTLRDRRDWINHGAIRRNPDFQLVFNLDKGPDKTIEEVMAEALRTGSAGMGVIVRLRWVDGDGQPADDVLQWQKEVLSELATLTQIVKESVNLP